MIVLFFADVVGKPGRELLVQKLPQLRADYRADAVIANGENLTDGTGLKPAHADMLFEAGVDVITTGNHVWRQREIYSYLDQEPRVIRPFNFLESNPGRGLTVIDTPAGRLAVLNLLGSLYLYPARSPFEVVNLALEQLQGIRNIVVDFHAEATSEKVALGWYLDGRVSAVIGTHTHIRTADARVLPGGTAYITDAGMCGARDSVIGVKKELVIERLVTQLPVRFEVAEQDVWLEGVVLEIGPDGRAARIEPFEVGSQ
ncbi:MAG: TIGR00282 family metallophosphoesterase [Thermoleophilia bacterium]|nr:TIGR00282 family metallophosphoesterase [Thermoleophilia bacterium]